MSNKAKSDLIKTKILLLEAAKSQIEKTDPGIEPTFICHAIDVQTLKMECTVSVRAAERRIHAASNELKTWIQHQLGSSDSLGAWLYTKYGVAVLNSQQKYKEKLKRTRLAWVDAMIEQLRKELGK